MCFHHVRMKDFPGLWIPASVSSWKLASSLGRGCVGHGWRHLAGGQGRSRGHGPGEEMRIVTCGDEKGSWRLLPHILL